MRSVDRKRNFFLDTYRRYPILVERGRGCWIYSSDGERYLDMLSGIGVLALGHSPKEVVSEVRRKISLHMHISNLFWESEQMEFAEEFVRTLKGRYKIFLSNSGAEAVEAALKFAKLPFPKSKRWFLAFRGSFHGRTHGALSATWKPDFRKPFLPLLPKFKFVEFGDTDKVKEELKKGVYAGVIVEPIQGEAGVITPPPGFLKDVKEICEGTDTLLILDEIQTGVGRTGRFWCYEIYGVKPDILVSAKAIGGGLPLGVTAVSEKLSDFIKPGTHGSTFGGNPLSCSAGKIVIRKVRDKKFLKEVERKGEFIKKEVEKMGFSVEGEGLMLGIVLGKKGKVSAQEVLDFLLKRRIIANVLETYKGDVRIRILPPLIIGEKEIEIFLSALRELKAVM